MTAYWSAMVSLATKRLQSISSEKVNLDKRAISIKERISTMQENQNTIWSNYEIMNSQKYLACSNQIQQRISQLQSQNQDGSKNSQIQDLYTQLQTAKTTADMELNRMKQLYNEEQQAQLKPLQQEQNRMETKKQDLQNDEETWKLLKQDYQQKNKESNQEFYGAGKS